MEAGGHACALPTHCCSCVVPAKAMRDAEFALVIQLHLTVAPQAKIAEMFDTAQFPQRLDSCAEYLRADGQAEFFTVVHGCPDHPRGLLPSRCQDGKGDRIEIGHGYGFWKLHVFPPQITADGGGHGRRAQFWMLSVDQLQHLKMQTGSQLPEGVDEWP